MTQTEARKLAAQRKALGSPAVAGAYPLDSWGGKEECWAVYMLTSSALKLWRK